MPEPAQTPDLKDLAITVVRQILKVYDLLDQDEIEEGADYDYRLNVIDADQILTLNIDVDDQLGRILTGRRKRTLQAVQKLIISAIHFRLGNDPGEKLRRFVRLSVNGQFQDPKKENGDEERPVEKKVATIILPPGVELRVLNPDGTSR
ncbi:hypothetical protein KKD80_03285 [Patescibacteria group bacterium]|nr:hypothetical protein [Patescibacteria group bacterium]